MHDELSDRAENFIIRINVAAFSTDEPTPPVATGTIETAYERSFEDYTPGAKQDDRREWTSVESRCRDVSGDLDEYIERFAEEFETSGIATTAPSPARVFEDAGVVVAVREITVLAVHNVAGLQLTFDVDLSDFVARYRESIDLNHDSVPVGGVDQQKIDDAWEDIGRFLHNELTWVTARLPTAEGSLELQNDDE